MKKLRSWTTWVSIITTLEFVAVIYFWNQLPKTVPSHWNVHGEVDGYSGRWLVLLAPFISILVSCFCIYVLRFIKDKGKKEKLAQAIEKFIVTFALFFAVVFVCVLLAALGITLDMSLIISVAVGIMLIPVGLIIRDVPQNYWIGVRLPATLENEEVWKKTNKLGGILIAKCGALFAVFAFFPAPFNFIVPIVALLAAIIYIAIYAHLLYNKLK